jgi:hypothetical protein
LTTASLNRNIRVHLQLQHYEELHDIERDIFVLLYALIRAHIRRQAVVQDLHSPDYFPWHAEYRTIAGVAGPLVVVDLVKVRS